MDIELFKVKAVNMLKYIKELLSDSSNDREAIIRVVDSYISLIENMH